MLKHTQQLLDALTKGQQAVLVSVHKAQGSVPRDEGAWMAVLPDQLINTLGGGQLEFQAVKEAHGFLQDPSVLSEPFIKRYPLGPSLGQCCGGVVHLSFEWVNETHLQMLTAKLGSPEPHLALFGGGHVGRAIVEVMEKLPWQITWIDSRESIFPKVVGKSVQVEHSEPVQAAVSKLKAHSHVLIMSFSHAEDLDVLQQCLTRQRQWGDLKSIGLIGSETKWATFKSRLKLRGFEPSEFERVQCPIGLPGLMSKEPEVIAVSVAAQLLMNEEQSLRAPVEC